MNTTDFDSIQTSIKRALSNIGNRNGHACPSGGSNHDPLLHLLLVSATGKSHFDSMHKRVLSEVTDAFAEEVDGAAVGRDTVLYAGGLYVLQVHKNKPATQMDNKAFVNNLRKLGVEQTVIDKAMADATKTKAPAKRFTVTPRV